MIGNTISHYTILEKLGEGGMGIVYKAEDTKLKRTVALKFLPSHLAASEDDKTRFMQEAQAAASLNHPNICTIYGIDEHEGSQGDRQMFFAMELVDGQTLREKKGSISFKQAIDIGIQIADGLAAAHEKGIVHRDIKPENIMIRRDGIAQIMDFGLAKLRSAESKISRLTKQGSTVGTAGYMSPEQVQGQDADHRSDIFSLGVLLYELLTGQIPFRGVHETALSYEIVNVNAAPPSSVNREIDLELDRIVLECLEKDPNERTQSAKQVAIDLKRAQRESGRQRASMISTGRPMNRSSQASGPESVAVSRSLPGAHRSTSWIMTGVIAIGALLLGFGISYFGAPKLAPLSVVRASIELPASITYLESLGGHTAISPDGSMVVFAGTDSILQSRLWLRHLNMTEVVAIAGTENATYPFWSPDNKAIGFFADGKVKTVSITGGPVLAVADAPFGRGGAWSKNGDILFLPSVNDLNLVAVPASGGATRLVTAFDSTINSRPRFPFFLPDGNHFVFSMLSLDRNTNETDTHIGSLDKNASRAIIKGATFAQYASGYLFFTRQGVLMAQLFDPASFSVSGNPVPLQGNINSWPARAKSDFSVSESGVLVYSHGVTGNEAEFVWTSADGVETSILKTEIFTNPTLSPDGTRIAFDAIDQAVSSSVWIYDMSSKAKLRLTFGQRSSARPVWSADQSKVYYNVELDGNKANIFYKRSDGSGEEVLVARGTPGANVGYYVTDASPDGRFLLVRAANESQSDLAMIDLQGTQTPLPVTMLGIRGDNGRFSPDGRLIVYESNESGSSRVFVASFGGGAGKWQISSDGAFNPYWRKDKIIYYSNSNNRYEMVKVTSVSETPNFSQPQPLFPSGPLQQNTIISGITPDGDNLGVRQLKGSSGGHLALVLHWKGMLEKQ